MRWTLSTWLARVRRALGPPAPEATAGAAVDLRPAHPAHGAGEPRLDCEAVMRQLWDYLDGELTAERTAAIRTHLELCKRCYPQYEFERSFLDAIAARARQHSDLEGLRSRVGRALRAQGVREA